MISCLLVQQILFLLLQNLLLYSCLSIGLLFSCPKIIFLTRFRIYKLYKTEKIFFYNRAMIYLRNVFLYPNLYRKTTFSKSIIFERLRVRVDVHVCVCVSTVVIYFCISLNNYFPFELNIIYCRVVRCFVSQKYNSDLTVPTERRYHAINIV